MSRRTGGDSNGALRRAIVVVLALAFCATAPWVILFGVNHVMGTPSTAFRFEQCTRYCHDNGCRHDPLLPGVIASHRGLFGRTVMALHAMGRGSGLGQRRGYGAANIVVFCMAWPGLMLLLVGVVTWQRLEIIALKRSNDG